MPDPASTICVGGMAVDRKYHALQPVLPATSNPVRGEQGFGGVARNVSENLARLGIATALISCIGPDEAGRMLVDHLQQAGVDVSDIAIVADGRTAEYSAVLNPDGNLAVAFADMAIFDALTPERLKPLLPRLGQAKWLFIDCNLPQQTIRSLIDFAAQSECRLAADAVSVAKAARLPDDMAGLDLLCLNRDEAAAMLDAGVLQPQQLVGQLLERGPDHVVLTLGEEGCLIGGPDGVEPIPAVAADPVDATGAGDAMVAGILARLVAGGSLRDAAIAGMQTAAATIASRGSVIPKQP